MKMFICLMAIVSFFADVIPLAAQTLWQGPVGTPASWYDPANWDSGSIPDTYARILNGGIAEISSGITNCVTIHMGGGDYGTLRVSGGILTNSQIYVGYNSPGGKLEALGGDILSPAKDMRIGHLSGVTGIVEITSGTVDMYRCIIGEAGVGEVTLSGGELLSHDWQSYVGWQNGTVGICTQNGGTRTFANNTSMYIGENTGSSGIYTLNDGTLSAANVSVARHGNATMILNGGTFNVPGAVFVGLYSDSTGTFLLNNFTNTFPQLIIGGVYPYDGGTGTVVMTGGDIILNSSSIGARPLSNARFVQNGGSLEFKQTVQFPKSEAAGMATADMIISNNAATVFGSDINMYNGGSLVINDSDVSMKSMYIRGSDSCVEMNGGTLSMAGRFFIPDGTNAATFHFNGGCMIRTEVQNQSYMFYVGGAAADSGPGTFIQTGGVWTNETGIYLARNSTNHFGRYEISGGTLYSPDRNLEIPKTKVGQFRLTGSAPDVTLRSISAATTNEFLLEFVLDKSPEHLSPVKFNYDRAYRCGHLRIGFDGGVLLSKTNEYTLLQWNTGTSAGYGDYLSKPDANMWTETLETANPASSRITLDNGCKVADLNMTGNAAASFSPHSMGHVTLSNLQTNRMISMTVDMAVTEVDKSVEELVAAMVAAGYTNSSVLAEGPYNLQCVIPAEYVGDQIANLSYFAWDFTDPTTLSTGAVVSALRIGGNYLPEMGTVILLN